MATATAQTPAEAAETAATRQAVRPPELVFPWFDTLTSAQGWVVVDKVINGMCGGGIFMSPGTTEQEVADIARNMSYKFTVTDPQIGGAKAGIRFSPADPRAKGVLRRFINANEKLLRTFWVTAGDLGTSDAFIEEVIQHDIGLVTCQATLGAKFSEVTGSPNLAQQVAWLNSLPASPYFPMIEAAVGSGVAEAARVGWELVGATGLPRVIIQGFGAVGSSLAYYLVTRNIGKVVAISDRDGFICDPTGLPVEELLQARANKVKQLKADGAGDHAVTDAQKNCLVNLTPEQGARMHLRRLPKMTPEQALCAVLEAAGDAEMLCPCAMRYQITGTVIDTLTTLTWKDVAPGCRFVVAGANNPFGEHTATGGLVEAPHLGALLYNSWGVTVVPDYVANSGTAQLFHRGLTEYFDRHDANVVAQVLAQCNLPIETFLTEAYSRFGFSPHTGKKSLAWACQRLTADRLEHPRTFMDTMRGFPSHEELAMDPRHHAKEMVADILNHAPAHTSRYALPALPTEQQLPLEERMALIDACDFELLTREEMVEVLRNNPAPVTYDGFEPSGRMHIAQGIMKSIIVNRMTQAGFTYLFWVADWFAQLNEKFGGDLKKIQSTGRYFIEVWKACGMDMSRVVFLWCSEELNTHSDTYWPGVLEIARLFNMKRVDRCSQIMGRSEGDKSVSQLFYPCMQCNDIFFLGVDVCQLGLDQRKVNVLAREYAAKKSIKPPVVASHSMLPGLKKGQEKMSKSDPSSAIYMEDTTEEVHAKVMGAFCPPWDEEHNDVLKNPVLAYYKTLVFPKLQSEGKWVIIAPLPEHAAVERDVEFHDFDSLLVAYQTGELAAKRIKVNLANYLDMFIQPVRDHFAANLHANLLREEIKQCVVVAFVFFSSFSYCVSPSE